MFRYIRGRPLDFRLHKGGVLLEQERRERSSLSKMVITRVEEEDEGEYTCSPAGGTNHSVTVTVLSASRGLTSSSSLMLCLLTLAIQ